MTDLLHRLRPRHPLRRRGPKRELPRLQLSAIPDHALSFFSRSAARAILSLRIVTNEIGVRQTPCKPSLHERMQETSVNVIDAGIESRTVGRSLNDVKNLVNSQAQSAAVPPSVQRTRGRAQHYYCVDNGQREAQNAGFGQGAPE